jgi:hypothetical protein
VFPQPAKDIAVPADQGIWLDDQQRLLPGSQPAGQQHEQHPLTRPGSGAFHLPVEDDQLLAQERIFQDEFYPAACQVSRDIGW